ncbi:Na/Pi cotransporter family protein [Atopobacter sp. AH10]|uniref:Na/Pi cotransporter family protein n=1 Tax=Atopobacter sp. AH10 TaxID=2315861 RepID=UPI000EF23AB8|nr:Na/Pi cotransporter family protein [Atopobacter sp. AH10]RLK62780.1 Na/Pi cotransporter family protein [Atopobacter sp. AH10]
MWISIVVQAVAGLGLFLFGMQLMSDGLQKVAGNKLKRSIEVLTSNRFIALLVGTVVTMIIQSSSATSVMVVGFVNAGIMELTQAFGVILGANIGTTITGQMVSLDVSKWAPFAIAIGLLMRGLKKSVRVGNMSDIFIGFGILFMGMDYLKNGLEPLGKLPEFQTMIIQNAERPLFGILIGLVMTVALQSSSATIGVLIALASQGLIPFTAAVHVIYGDNIGTCTTALISSIGTTPKARRVAMIHLLFNLLGTLVFLAFLNPLVVPMIEHWTPNNVPRQIANIHTIFNIINVAIFFPFGNWFIKAVNFLVPDKKNAELILDDNTRTLDDRILASPSIALHRVIVAIQELADEAGLAVESAIKACQLRDKNYVQETFDHEQRINALERRIVEFLVKLSQESLSEDDSALIDELFQMVADIERIGDHSENIAEYVDANIDAGVELAPESVDDLNQVFKKVKEGYHLMSESLVDGDVNKAQLAMETENDVDDLKAIVRQRHIERMNKGLATPMSGIFVMDLLSNLERISDHYRNICESILEMEGDIQVS